MKRLIERGEDQNDTGHYNRLFVSRFKKRGFDLDQPGRERELIKDFTGGRFLEVGCGIAPHCLNASKIPNSEVWGLDLASDLIPLLKIKYPQVNYIFGDGNDLPFKDNYFDYLIAGEFLEHMEDPEKTIKEFLRVLKPGGRFVCSVPYMDAGQIAPSEHIWSYNEADIRNLLGGMNDIRTYIFEEDKHKYIIGNAKK